MAKAEDHERAREPQSGSETPDTKPDSPAVQDAKSQDKQKDKPDSGQNEDG